MFNAKKSREENMGAATDSPQNMIDPVPKMWLQ